MSKDKINSEAGSQELYHLKLQQALLTCGCIICKCAYLLTGICNLKIKAVFL